MKTLAAIFSLATLSLFTVGCSDEAQLENAQEEFQEERVETQEEINEAGADGVVTAGEAEDVAEERAETEETAGEVAEQTGDLIEATKYGCAAGAASASSKLSAFCNQEEIERLTPGVQITKIIS